MKQLLIDVVDFLKEDRGLTMSDISKELGKGRNFISEAIKRGYKDEEQYIALISNIMHRLFGLVDHSYFCAFINKKHQAELHKSGTAGDKVIDSLHEKIAGMNQSEIAQDKVITKQSETIKSLEHRITMLNKNIDAHEEYRKRAIRSMTKNHELSTESNKLNMDILELQKSNRSYKATFESQDIAIKKLKKDLALQESLLLEQDLELRKYKKLADGKEEQVKACFRALSSSRKEKAYLFGGFMLLSVLVLVILYLSFMHIKI